LGVLDVDDWLSVLCSVALCDLAATRFALGLVLRVDVDNEQVNEPLAAVLHICAEPTTLENALLELLCNEKRCLDLDGLLGSSADGLSLFDVWPCCVESIQVCAEPQLPILEQFSMCYLLNQLYDVEYMLIVIQSCMRQLYNQRRLYIVYNIDLKST
jgi:hypothetical protein